MALKNYNKECERAVLSYNSLWRNLKAIFFAHSFSYPVVYTDGFVSEDKKDRNGRTPLGIVVKGVILRIDAPDEKMTLSDAFDLMFEDVFAGFNAYLPPFEVLLYVRNHIKTINRLLKELGGTEFFGDWYVSCNEYTEDTPKIGGFENKRNLSNLRAYAVHMNLPSYVGNSYSLVGDKNFIRIVYCHRG